MAVPITEQSKAEVCFAYDGDCLICTRAAQYLRIKKKRRQSSAGQRSG
jgi:hypothetical protein